MTSEQQAIAVSQDRKQLRARLMEARAVLNPRYDRFFQRKHLHFDFAGKRLDGFGGWYLKWSLRLEPNQPESYENQQTSVGCVTLGKDAVQPAPTSGSVEVWESLGM